MKRVALGEPTKKPVSSGAYKLTQNPDGWFHRGFAVSEVFTPTYTARYNYSNSPFSRVPPGIQVQPWGVGLVSRKCPLRILPFSGLHALLVNSLALNEPRSIFLWLTKQSQVY